MMSLGTVEDTIFVLQIIPITEIRPLLNAKCNTSAEADRYNLIYLPCIC